MSDPNPTETTASDSPGLWQRPVFRGAINGLVFTIMLCVIQVLGFFRPERPLDDESIAANILAGVVFGFAMYILELWRRTRRTNAADAARQTVERKLREQDPEDGDGRR
ncbi:hypothetical protein [Thalassobaculum sp.]|uniref:hypothetical protein n=1 Tax=Thalassobaculum sp. TaxID=2022740 RepID=UPI0032EFEAB1